MLINCPVSSVLCYLCLPVQMSITGQRIERACISDRKMLQVLHRHLKNLVIPPAYVLADCFVVVAYYVNQF